MRTISTRDRLAYFFDKTMSRGAIAMIGWLGLVTFALIFVAALALSALHFNTDPNDPNTFVENLWQGAMYALDAGALGGASPSWGYRAVMAVVTLGGLFILSTLIGILAAGLESKLDELRKGRSFVIEESHTLILGWSPKIFTIISELAIAQESESKPSIVILADQDKVEMEDQIRSEVSDLKNTRVICRSGNPTSLIDLDIVNPYQCGSVIVLSPEEGNADSQTLKTVLALTNSPNRRKKPFHIVAEVRDRRNLDVLTMVGKDEVELLLSDDLIARVMVQTCRQSGLSIVYTELMDFDGAEIYINEEPTVVGRTFGEALMAYPHCSLIGLRYANGETKVNPPMDTVIQKGDQVIAIAEDDSTLKASSSTPTFAPSKIAIKDEPPVKPERTLMLGWNHGARILLSELDNYVQPGSYLKVVSTYDVSEAIAEVQKGLLNSTLDFITADTTDREVLEAQEAHTYDHILLLCYKDELEPHDADALTLISLLHLRNISETTNVDLSIVSEMLDARNRELAEVTKADDFIVSDKMISLLMSQVSQNKYLMRVFEDLFNADGSEIYLKPASLYSKPGEAVSFYALVDAARARGQVAIGYRRMADQFDASKAYGVTINPRKDADITLAENDLLVIIAES